VSLGPDLAIPEVGRAARLHDDGRRRRLGEIARELPAREPVPLRHRARSLGDGPLEHGLVEIHSDRRRMQLGLLTIWRKEEEGR
jgi:hypothetical protein